MAVNFDLIDLDHGDLNESSFEDDYDQLGLRKASGVILISIRHNKLSRVPDHLSLNMYGLDISNNNLHHARFPRRWSEKHKAYLDDMKQSGRLVVAPRR